MSCIFVLCVASPQKHLSTRPDGYADHALDGVWFLVRNERASPTLGHRDGRHIRFGEQLLNDFGSITGPGEASFFCVEPRPKEDLRARLRRGRRLPFAPANANAVQIDAERYLLRHA
ncbi:MAG: hypothetical protein ACK5M4_13380 [Pseudorhodobacter sp.]